MPRKANSDVLTQERIVEAALQLIDQKGLQQFSMRALAEELQVDAKAVYYHLPNKEAIIIGTINLAFSQLHFPEAGTKSWQEDVRAITQVYRQFAMAHPHLFNFLTTYNQNIPVAFEIDERLAQILFKAGFQPKVIVQLVNALLIFIAGCVQEQLNGVVGHSTDLEEVYERFRKLPPARYPAIHSISQNVGPQDLATNFDFTLDLVIRGAEAHTQDV